MVNNERQIFKLLSQMEGSCNILHNELNYQTSQLYHTVMYCVNEKYRSSDFAKRAVICMKLRQKLSLLWAKQDIFGHLLGIVGSYDDFHQRLRDYSLNANAGEEMFLSEALKINIIHIDVKGTRIIWPDSNFDECIVLAWLNGSCIPVGLTFTTHNKGNIQYISPSSYFRRWF